MSFAVGAAFLIKGLTAYHLLHTADATGPGRTVLVHPIATVDRQADHHPMTEDRDGEHHR
jgi:hypothetical protein